MEETSPYLEGIGHGKIGRIVVGKFKIGVDLQEEMIKELKAWNRVKHTGQEIGNI